MEQQDRSERELERQAGAIQPRHTPGDPPRHDAPWLRAEAVAQAQRILRGHAQAFGRPLLTGLALDADPRQWAQALFSAGTVVLSHDGQDPGGDPGPRLTYANAAALRLWRRPWAELVGMPSRLTAEADLFAALATGYDSPAVVDAVAEGVEAVPVRPVPDGGEGAVVDARSRARERLERTGVDLDELEARLGAAGGPELDTGSLEPGELVRPTRP